MPIETIREARDPRVQCYRALPSRRREQREGHFIVEGHWLVERLWRSPYAVLSVLVAETRLGDVPPELIAEVPVYVVSQPALHEILGFSFHRGVLAAGRRTPLPGWSELDRGRWSPRPLVVVAEAIVDPENLGALLRNAAAFGVDAVVLGPHCADLFSRRVLRVSMGHALLVPCAYTSNVADTLRDMSQEEFITHAAVLAADARAVDRVPKPNKSVLVFGGEGHGLLPPTVRACHHQVTIPMHGGTDSLNVATAAAVFLHEFRRACQFE